MTGVLYWSWQLQCCGDGFAVGDRVSWTALAADSELRTQVGSDIDWCEEHHPRKGQRLTTLEGTVTAIRMIREGVAEDVQNADGTAATGYVVTLS